MHRQDFAWCRGSIRCATYVAVLASAVSIVGCGRSRPQPTKTDRDSIATAAGSFSARVDALQKASEITFWTGDFDADGVPDLAIGSAPGSHTTDGGAGVAIQALTTTDPMASTAVVLTHDAGGSLVAATSNAGFKFSAARAILTLATSDLPDAIAWLVRVLRTGEVVACDLLTAIVNLVMEGLRSGTIKIAEAVALLETVFGNTAPANAPPPDFDFVSCLQDGQTMMGCAVIYAATRACDAGVGCGHHCYHVSDGTVSTTCDTPAQHLALCSHASNPSGCCNADFVFGKILPSDLRNVAPMPVDPSMGPVPGPNEVVLLDGLQPSSELLVALTQAVPAAGVAACLANGVATTRNPIEISLDGQCAVNKTQPAHVLQGKVTQCVGEDAMGVYSTIVGDDDGTNTRFATLNELVGPAILYGAWSHFRGQVQQALHDIDAQGLCCVGKELRGGTASVDPQGGLSFQPTSESAVCTAQADGGTDAGLTGMGDAGDAGGSGAVDAGMDGSDGTSATGGNGGTGGSGGTGSTDGAVGRDAAPSADSDSGTDGATDCKLTPEACALCTWHYSTATIALTSSIRGTWQYNPGGPYVTLAAPGYPCDAFLHDSSVRPALDDPNWIGAPNGQFIGFSESSTVPSSGYTQVQFRYFRSLVFIPANVTPSSLQVVATGIDDSLHIVIYNSRFPQGVSPTDAGPMDPSVGVCQGNGSANWDFRSYVQSGEVNVIFVVHSDMNPSTSSLASVDIVADGQSVPTFDCSSVSGVN